MPELVFKGKEYVYNHHLTVPYRPLIPFPDKSIGPGDLAGNLIIHGDNLHALKSLLPRYAGKVDLIFIDPPYNTGNENWSYNDNVNSPIMREWLKSNPVNVEDMLRHDKWLCMMWPRLVLLRELLKPEGVLLMSLDDNEQYHAKLIGAEIFGEASLLGQFVWKSRQNKDNRNENGLSVDHEYILAFGASIRGTRRGEEQFANSDNDSRGPWASSNMVGLATKENRPNLHFVLINPETNRKYPPPFMGWRYGPETMAQLISEKKILWPSSPSGRPRQKVFMKDLPDRTNASTVIDFPIFTRDGTLELEQILGNRDFPFPKPSDLIAYLVEIGTPQNALILDSFAGSGTTAHAVLKTNKKDSGNRRFILVEGEDYADRTTAERVRRVINGYAFIGTQREELLREKVTWTKLQKSTALLEQVEAIKQREGFAEREDLARVSPENRRFDKVNVRMDDGVLLVEGEKKISERVEGLGGEFTYCTLGEPIDAEKILSGKQLPDYASLAAWLFYTATGGTLAKSRIKEKEFFVGNAQDRYVWLIYKPDLAFLKSPDAALTLSFARKLREQHQKQRHLVFAPAKYLSNKQLLEFGVDFAPLPFALYREA